ncbi:hypothetical protein BSLG_005920 [Batrachochytrium salamandrivorans]|nr:hypothetical protein BSLG_005920 [Batrachochytrium salamandrivorans]
MMLTTLWPFSSTDSSGITLALAYLQNDDFSFVTGGVGTLRVWELNVSQRKIRATNCQTGQIKRVVKCIDIDQNDEFMYCGTTTGDLMQVNLRTKLFKHSGPPKEKELFFYRRILSAALTPKGDEVIVGCGDGVIAKLSLPKLIFAGTAYSNIYTVILDEFSPTLKSTCHYASINDICFQHGSSLISGWNDGKIRAFGPQSGRLQYEINDAHKRCVTALAVTEPFNSAGDFRVVSGGEGKYMLSMI